MSREIDPLDRLASAAAHDPLPAIDDRALDRMTSIARVAARARRRSRRIRAAVACAAMVSVALGLAITGIGRVSESRPVAAIPIAAPLAVASLALPTGDRIAHVEGTRLAAESIEPRARAFVLDGGEALFDVAPLAGGESFRVRTPHLRLHVVGTVFAVAVTEERTRIEVFEGRVWVEGARTLAAGERYDSTEVSTGWRSRLAAEGRAAAARRPARVAAPIVEPPPSPAPVAPVPREATIEQIRRWIVEGAIERALHASARGEATHALDPQWVLLRADALRAAGQAALAADRYDRAAALSTPSHATQPGYLAAELRLRVLDDPVGALASLDRSRAAEPNSPIEERALALRVRALAAAGRAAEARADAERYLLRFPAGAERDRIEVFARPAD